MFSSVFNVLKSQTERLKESLNGNTEETQSFSARLKENLVQKSTTLAQNLQGLISTANSSLSSTYDSLSTRSSENDSLHCDKYLKNERNTSFRNSSRKQDRRHNGNDKNVTLMWPLLENGNKTWVELVELPTAKSKLTSNNNKSGCGGNAINKDDCGDLAELKCVTQDENVINWKENESESDFFSDEDEDENVTQKFTRITGIGYRASKRRSDREEIRRRLALESDDLIEKPMGRKPSLHSRLQSKSVLPTTGMNLQICFMNETASDSESPNSDTESKNQQPASLPCVKAQSGVVPFSGGANSSSDSAEDFQTKHARLQAEARQALSQAKEMARLQMAQEKDQRLSPITEMLRNSLEKVGVQLQPERRRLTRQLLTEMNVAQLQVIVNDLHSHIEMLNETLVSLLLERDDLHMEQDSMLVDIEDLTRYLAAKDNSPHQSLPVISARSYLGKK